jgi:hypothetical protein
MWNLSSRCSLIVITTLIALTISHVLAFQQRSQFLISQRSPPSFHPLHNKENKDNKKTRVDYYGTTSLFMGKFRNKQAELQKKMMLAKQQAAQRANEGDDESSPKADKQKMRMTDEEQKEANDRKRFEGLLNSHSASIGASEKSSENYLSQEQEEENIDAYRKCFLVFLSLKHLENFHDGADV